MTGKTFTLDVDGVGRKERVEKAEMLPVEYEGDEGDEGGEEEEGAEEDDGRIVVTFPAGPLGIDINEVVCKKAFRSIGIIRRNSSHTTKWHCDRSFAVFFLFVKLIPKRPSHTRNTHTQNRHNKITFLVVTQQTTNHNNNS